MASRIAGEVRGNGSSIVALRTANYRLICRAGETVGKPRNDDCSFLGGSRAFVLPVVGKKCLHRRSLAVSASCNLLVSFSLNLGLTFSLVLILDMIGAKTFYGVL